MRPLRTLANASANININVNVVFFLVGVAVSLATAACSSTTTTKSGGEENATSAASADTAGSFCTTYCTKIISCDSSMDTQTCTEQCGSKVKASLEKLRDDVVTATATCWQSSDCRQVLSDTRLGDCIADSVVSIAPSDEVKSFCDALDASYSKCDSSLDHAACLNSMKVFGDETLTTASACTEKSCSAIVGCVNATLAL